MYFGQNAFNLVMANIQPLVLLAIAVVGLVLLVQHKTVGMVMLIGAAIVAVGLVFNPTGAKDAMLSVFNTVIGGGVIMGVAPFI